jgi:spore maturation protein CgeB
MFLERNLAALGAANPDLAAVLRNARRGGDLAVVPTKAGAPSLRAGDTALHSLYDPLQEAREWAEHYRTEIAEGSELVVLGFGLGHHVAELLRRTEKPVTVVEPRADVLRSAMEASDLAPVIGRARIVTDGEKLRPSPGFRVLRHASSVRLSPAPFAGAASRLAALAVAAEGLRVAVVGPFYGGSLPIARYCVSALERLGHEVEFIDNSVYAATYHAIDAVTASTPHRDVLRVKFGEFASEAAMARIVPFRPDLVLALAQAPLGEAALECLRNQGIATAFWFVEDFRHMAYWRSVAARYDHFFAIQRGAFLDQLREAGAGHAAYLPMAASPAIHRKIDLSPEDLVDYGNDVSFVGAGYYNRRKLFEGLLDLDFGIWGDGWEGCHALEPLLRRNGARVSTEESVKVFNAARINVNLHSSSYHEGVNPDGDFVNPRTFEIAACGRFQLVDSRAELGELFRVGVEVTCFEGLAQLREMIAYYLAHPQEREAVAGRGRQRALRDHTYERRMETLIVSVLRAGYESPWKAAREREDPGRLVREAGTDSELGRYLGKFAGRRSLKLEDVVGRIRSDAGELSRIERTFLTLHEIAR